MIRLLVCLLLTFVLAGACYCQNPYGVAGSGVLTKLGMPSGCMDYQWDSLLTANPINMVRPCRYWLYVGVPHQYWGYHETTDTIDNPTQFASYVSAHPGKIWVIGNEPDIYPQDGLTQDQYANMFHTYYTFIKNLDPTAKFCIGAITGGSNSGGFTYTKGWYEAVLALYKSKFGVTMPVDIWNIHSYCGPSQIEDPDKIINEFMIPFVNWCHTVESGAYAGCEVWVTECQIGEWNGALSEDNIVWFIQRYLPRLELAGISRWFWYVSVDWDGKQGSCPLTRAGQITPVGAAYSALANGYPNAVIPVTPFVPPAGPAYAQYDFSGQFAAPWFNKGGYWSFTGGELRHTGIYQWSGTSCALLYTYQDSGISFRMKINSAPDPINWGGIAVRVANRLNVGWESGYLLFVRQNGAIGINNNKDGTIVEIAGGVDHPENWHTYRMLALDNNIKVWVDDVLKIDWTDADRHYTSGYTIVQVHKADATYDDFHVLKYPTPTPVVTDDGAYTTDLSHIHAVWSAGDPGCGISGYRYAVGTSSGAADVIGWTYTTETSLNAALTLTSGTKYYVSVKAAYPDGFESGVGASDGIVAAVGCATILQAKSLPSSTYVLMEGKIVSAVFPDSAYIQEPRGIGGMRLLGALPLQAGDVVKLLGKTTLDGKEAALKDVIVLDVVHGTPPKPLFVNNRASGGGAVGLQPATIDSVGSPNVPATGLSPIGTLVRTNGKVTFVDQPGESYIYVDDGSKLADGSGHSGVKVSLAYGPVPVVGANAVVTGCCGATDVAGNCARYLRPRSAADVSYDQVLSYLRNSGFETGSYSPWTYSGTGGGIRSGTWNGSITAHSGTKFFGAYAYASTCSGCLTQTVSLPAGVYQASVWSRVYHSYNDPMAAANRVGIDPTGGTDPNSPNVVWSAWDTQSRTAFSEWHQIFTPSVSVSGNTCTIFVQYSEQFNSGHHMNCLDEVVLTAL